jgi:hypothetical protein
MVEMSARSSPERKFVNGSKPPSAASRRTAKRSLEIVKADAGGAHKVRAQRKTMRLNPASVPGLETLAGGAFFSPGYTKTQRFFVAASSIFAMT